MSLADHVQAVGVARLAVQEFENHLVDAKSHHESALVAIQVATGENPIHQTARNALELMIGIESQLDEVIRFCEQVKMDLDDYGASFI